jgi:hypothetical protein
MHLKSGHTIAAAVLLTLAVLPAVARAQTGARAVARAGVVSVVEPKYVLEF